MYVTSFGNKVLAEWNQVKVGVTPDYKWSPNPMTAVLIRRGKFVLNTGSGHVKQRQRLGQCIYKAKGGQRRPATPEAMRDGRGFPTQLPERTSPAASIQTSGLRMSERINICHFWGTKVQWFVAVALGNWPHPVNIWCPTRSPSGLVLSFLRKWGRGHSLSFPWGTIFTDGARSSPGAAPPGLQRPPWLCPKQRGIPEGTCEVGLSLSGSATTMRTGPISGHQDPWGWVRERPQTFFLFCFYWDCTEVCRELYLFAEWGILHFQNQHSLYFWLIPPSKML